jgi:hypothetical protein
MDIRLLANHDQLVDTTLRRLSTPNSFVVDCSAQDIAVRDMFVVQTIGLDLLYGYVIVRLARRELA